MNPVQASWRRVQDKSNSFTHWSLEQGLFLHPKESGFLDDMIFPRSTLQALNEGYWLRSAVVRDMHRCMSKDLL